MKTGPSFLKTGTFIRKKYDRILLASSLAWMVSFIDGCADSLLAGIFLDDMAVSAVALVQPIASVISFLAYLVSVGTVTAFSRESGAFHKEKAYQYVGQGIICSAVISLFMVITMLLIREPYLLYYQATEEITELAREYYSCEIFYALAYPIYFIIYQLVSIDGDEVCCFIAALISAVTNIVSSYLLVGPFGVSGLAYGSVIGMFAGILGYSAHFFFKTNSVHIRAHFNIHEVLEVIKVGSATSMTLLYVAFIDIVMNRFVIAVYGDIYLPAYAVVNFLLNMGAVFASLYDACSGFVTVAYGEKNPVGIKNTMDVAYRGAIVLSSILLVLLELAAPYVPELYGITDPAVYEASIFAARVIPATYPVLAIYNLFDLYYPIVGHVALGHLLSAIYMLISPLVLAAPLGFAFGFNGLSVGFMLTCVVAVAVTLLVVRVKYGKKAVPLILVETDEEAIIHEIVLTQQNISALCEKVGTELSERGVNPSITNEAQLILEEGYMSIMEKNHGKKVISECDILISDKLLRLITRDNGKIFDITDSDAKVKDFRSYVLARIMENNSDHNNTTTISFNRNSYFWKLNE